MAAALSAFSCLVSYPLRYSCNGNRYLFDRNDNRYRGIVNIKMDESSSSTRSVKLYTLNEIAGAGKGSPSLATATETEEHIRQRILTQKQLVDPYRQGLIIEKGVGYRQTVVVRSYEVGPYKTATLESL